MAKNRQTRHVRPASTNQQATARAYYDRSLALVIGIDDYGSHNSLKNAVNDATSVAEVLKVTHGFEVETLFNEEATREALSDWLHDDLPDWVGVNDRLVIFFAGHGVTREIRPGYSRGFLVPYGASDRYATYVDMFTVRDACSWIPAKHILIVLDCCFSGILGVTTDQRSEQTPQVNDIYLERVTEAPAWQVLTAGRADELAADSSNRPGHSAFTSALLDGLEGHADQDGDGIITARSLADYVEPRVIRETTARGGYGQTPYFSYLTGSGAGNVVFVLPPIEAPAVEEVIEAPPTSPTVTEELMRRVEEAAVVLDRKPSQRTEAEQEKVDNAEAMIDQLMQQRREMRRENSDEAVAAFARKFRQWTEQSPIDFNWVTIPAGEFLMGSDKRKGKLARDEETPQHKLTLPEYHIARVPVTNAQYHRFVAATGQNAPSHWRNGNIPDDKEDYPVTQVSWNDAIAFCEWAKVRLPSEAEWEKAARGTDGLIWPWGNNEPTEKLCNFNNNVKDTTPVGSYPDGASPYGCLDMAGNVWEWTRSLWGTDWEKPQYGYPYDALDGREEIGASADIRRVLRGGSFLNYELRLRCAARLWNSPLHLNVNYGFRVCAAPITPDR